MVLNIGGLNIVSTTKKSYWRLGVYPEISLADAREKRREARKMIDGGIDPSQDRKKKKALSLENAENTFEAIAREWHETNKSKWSGRYAEGIMTRLSNLYVDDVHEF
ncbi:MAG: integrase arm-type DNA-binding domain-containing protein [Alphaproteobacteria bacterium]|nr:integrase arm-type DNA-binding domain-containing protein [Alphaproteobacteria bacterium]